MNTISIIARERNAGSMRCTKYSLSNGWYIYSAQCSQDQRGGHQFSIWRPDSAAIGGATCVGGAKTLKGAVAEASRLAGLRKKMESEEPQ